MGLCTLQIKGWRNECLPGLQAWLQIYEQGCLAQLCTADGWTLPGCSVNFACCLKTLAKDRCTAHRSTEAPIHASHARLDTVVQDCQGLAGVKLLVECLSAAILQVWQKASMFLSLDEEGISLFRLPAFKLHCLANRTRHAQRFAWDGGRAMLAVALRKKLLLFHYNGNEFVELKEFSLADSVSKMAWLGESICLGLKKE